jgi:WD40 repeat protein
MTQSPSSLCDALAPLATGEPVVAAAFLGNVCLFARADGGVSRADGDMTIPGAAMKSEELRAHPNGAVISAASDTRRLLTGGDDGRIVETRASGECVLLVEEQGHWIDALATRSDGGVAWTAGRAVRARDASGETKSLDLPSTSRGVAFLPKGYRLVVAHYGGATLWYPNTGAKPETLEWKGSHLDVTVSPDGRFVITSMQENTLHGWRLSDNKNMRMSGYPAKTRSLSWSKDGNWLATSGADACILWPFQGKDGPMGAAPRECGVRAGVGVTRVAYHPTAQVVAVGYEDGMVLLCRVSDGSELLARKPVAGAKISALAWDQTGARLAFGAENGEAGVLALPRG